MEDLSYAPPEIRVLAVGGGPLRQVDRIAPFGVPTAGELPGMIELLPSHLANAAGEVVRGGDTRSGWPRDPGRRRSVADPSHRCRPVYLLRSPMAVA